MAYEKQEVSISVIAIIRYLIDGEPYYYEMENLSEMPEMAGEITDEVMDQISELENQTQNSAHIYSVFYEREESTRTYRGKTAVDNIEVTSLTTYYEVSEVTKDEFEAIAKSSMIDLAHENGMDLKELDYSMIEQEIATAQKKGLKFFQSLEGELWTADKNGVAHIDRDTKVERAKGQDLLLGDEVLSSRKINETQSIYLTKKPAIKGRNYPKKSVMTQLRPDGPAVH